MKLAKHLAQGKIIYFHDGQEKLTVCENNYFRWLSFNNTVQSVMHRRAPWRLTLPHQTALALPLLFINPKSIIELGLGGGNMLRFLNHIQPNVAFSSVEINLWVINCFQQYFNPTQLTSDLIHLDSYVWLQLQTELLCDWLLLDLYSQQQSENLTNTLNLIAKKLPSRSTMSVNFTCHHDEAINALLKQLSLNFPEREISYFHVPHYQNIIIHISPFGVFSAEKTPLTWLKTKPYIEKRWQQFWRHGIKVK